MESEPIKDNAKPIEDEPSVLQYHTPEKKVRGADFVVRVCAGFASVLFTLFGLLLYFGKSGSHDHPGRFAAIAAFGGAAFLGCVTAGLIGFRKDNSK